MTLPAFPFFQDGAHFYADRAHDSFGWSEGQCVWSAPYKVRDSDIHAAIEARVNFTQWLGRVHGLAPDFGA